jgi:hypothetical protein
LQASKINENYIAAHTTAFLFAIFAVFAALRSITIFYATPLYLCIISKQGLMVRPNNDMGAQIVGVQRLAVHAISIPRLQGRALLRANPIASISLLPDHQALFLNIIAQIKQW